MADIFVSYTSSDRDWAFWIGQELEKLGHVAHVHEWEISAGGNVPQWMEERHQNADHVLLVVSKLYLTKDYSNWERLSAEWATLSRDLALRCWCSLRLQGTDFLLAPFKRCDLYGLTEPEAQARLAAYLTPAARPSSPALFPGARTSGPGPAPRTEPAIFPGGKLALSNIPIRTPEHFLGRNDALEAIDAGLKRYEGRVAITTLYGLRGVGKTTLAAAYAEQRRRDYRGGLVDQGADSRHNARGSWRARGYAARLGRCRTRRRSPALDAVHERLQQEGEGLLLIYDNAIDAASLRPYLPVGGAARVLVTSNTHVWRGVAAPVEIRLWPGQVGADYLIARTGRERERPEAEALSEELGGLPLAHEQAAAYCERLEVSLDEYLRRFRGAPTRLLDDEKDAPAEYDRRTVVRSFALDIDEAATLHPAAEPLIAYAAQLASEPILLFLFSDAREKFGEPLASQLAGDGLDEAVGALRAFALVDRGNDR